MLADDFLEELASKTLAGAASGWVDPLLLLAGLEASVFELEDRDPDRGPWMPLVVATENSVYYRADADPLVVRRRLFLGLAQLLLLRSRAGHIDSDVHRLAAWLGGAGAPTTTQILRTHPDSDRTPPS